MLSLFLIIAMLGLAALAIDVGYMMMARSELQRAADSAAMAGTWELIDEEAVSGSINLTDEITAARAKAAQFVSLNRVCATTPTVDQNTGNNVDGDVVVGYLSNPSDPNCQMSFSDPNRFNAVQVTVRKSAARNGEVPLFFARIWGRQSQGLEAHATAALLNNIGSFQAPPAGHRLDILPFALDKETWDALVAGGGTDGYRWDAATKTVSTSTDGIREANLYPQDTGSAGNRGTVDIGSSNNSTSDLARQIVDGISAADLAHHGGELKFDGSGKLSLNGDPGISAGIKDELASIIGQTRMIPICSGVSGSGNNAQYTIVKFVGVRIMAASLTGKESQKYIYVQPATIMAWGATPSTGATTSTYIYSPVWLVR